MNPELAFIRAFLIAVIVLFGLDRARADAARRLRAREPESRASGTD